MFSKIIKNIKSKPEPVRKGITLGVSIGVTGIITVFWFVSFLHYSSEILLTESKTESPTSFLSKMTSLVGESYANVRSKIYGQNVFTNEQASTSESNTIDSYTEQDAQSSTSSDIIINTSNNTSNNTSSSTGDGVYLEDILNTKRPVNQENKATTSSEVLVQ